MAHAHCMPDTYGYKHTLRICTTYRFSIATVVERTRRNVTLPSALYVLLAITIHRNNTKILAAWGGVVVKALR